MLSPNDLFYFHTLIKAKNLRQASDQLHVTQPALSHAIKRLELAVGFELFERSRAGLRLTRAGQTLVRTTEALLDQWKDIPSALEQEENSIKGKVRLGVHPAVAMFTIDKFLPKLLSENSKIEIILNHDLSRKITQAIIDSEIDLGIVVNPVAHPELVIRELGRDEVTLFQISGNNNSETIIYDPSLSQAQWILGKLGKKQTQFHRHLHSSDLQVVCQLVASGAGVGILPTRVASLSNKKLIRWSPDAPSFQDKICLAYRPGFRKSAVGKIVIEAITSGVV